MNLGARIGCWSGGKGIQINEYLAIKNGVNDGIATDIYAKNFSRADLYLKEVYRKNSDWIRTISDNGYSGSKVFEINPYPGNNCELITAGIGSASFTNYYVWYVGGSKVHYEIGVESLKINGVEKMSVDMSNGLSNSPNPLYIFSDAYYKTSTQQNDVYLYSLDLTDLNGNVTVRLRPTLSDGVACLINLVDGKIYKSKNGLCELGPAI